MAKTNLFYLLLLTVLFWGFISFLDGSRVKADSLLSNVSYDLLKYEWVVSEVKDINTSQDVTDRYKAKVLQFLSSGGFVEYEDKVVQNTGSWKMADDQLLIKYDDNAMGSTKCAIEMVRPGEMLMLKDNLQIRLLRLQL